MVTNAVKDKHGLTLHLVGLGDVGGTLLTGLVLLGEIIQTIGIYDPDGKRVSRYEQEMNQILPVNAHKVRVVALTYDQLFENCDAFIFTASAGVPALGSGVHDVRMAQYAKNRSILTPYALLAVEKTYSGLFIQVSDPVDRLCSVVARAGIAPSQIIGCGLGVMLARADYCARKHGIEDFLSHGRVYGPHGEGLVVADNIDDAYDDGLSRELTQEVITANLAVRETGFKPYIAPGISSGCLTILRILSGDWFDGSVWRDDLFVGCRARLTANGYEFEAYPQHPQLRLRIDEMIRMMRTWKDD